MVKVMRVFGGCVGAIFFVAKASRGEPREDPREVFGEAMVEVDLLVIEEVGKNRRPERRAENECG
jgi:hypothetical protein